MQQADEAIARRDIRHCLLGVDGLQAIDHLGEGQGTIDCLDGRVVDSVWLGWRGDLFITLVHWPNIQVINISNSTYTFEPDALPQLILEPLHIHLLRHPSILHVFWSESATLCH